MAKIVLTCLQIHSGRSYSSDRYSFYWKKRPLAIAAINAELPPFENGEHNSESVSKFYRDKPI